MKTIKTIQHYMPAIFCACISLIQLGASIGTSKSGWGTPVLTAFLPLVFFLVGNMTLRMYREILELKQRLAALEQRDQKMSS